MDEMRVNLKTKFMRGVAAKIIKKMIFKQTGVKVDIQIDEFDLWNINGDTTLKLNVEAKLNSEEFNKIMESIDKD